MDMEMVRKNGSDAREWAGLLGTGIGIMGFFTAG